MVAMEQAMQKTRLFAATLFLVTSAQMACALLSPTQAIPPAETTATAQLSIAASAEPSASPSAQPSAAAATTAPNPTAVHITPRPTTAKLQLEILQSQAWTDAQGNARVNVLFRNPYDFPVALGFGARAAFYNSAGDLLRAGSLYFWDGISGGGGFIQPGEIIAANACPTCEEALLTEDWASVEFFTSIEDATGQWTTSTEVEPGDPSVEFESGSAIFSINGTVKNNSATALQRISVRVIVVDQEGKLVGAGEASAYAVESGATATVSGYGFGQRPAGPVEYQVSALGVNY
jgi:hypothetical protein